MNSLPKKNSAFFSESRNSLSLYSDELNNFGKVKLKSKKAVSAYTFSEHSLSQELFTRTP